jgi:hypothetical protein
MLKSLQTPPPPRQPLCRLVHSLALLPHRKFSDTSITTTSLLAKKRAAKISFHSYIWRMTNSKVEFDLQEMPRLSSQSYIGIFHFLKIFTLVGRWSYIFVQGRFYWIISSVEFFVWPLNRLHSVLPSINPESYPGGCTQHSFVCVETFNYPPSSLP